MPWNLRIPWLLFFLALDYGNEDSIVYKYNTRGQVTRETYEDGAKVTYRYGNSGELAAVIDSETGIVQRYTYDLIDRPAQYRETGGDYDLTLTYGYDDYGRLSRRVEAFGTGTRTERFEYNEDGRLKSLRKGNGQQLYEYDIYDRISGKTFRHASTGLDVLEESFTYRNPSDSKTTSQVATHRAKSADDYDVTWSYTYDKNGNILSVSDGTNTTSYVYDTANQCYFYP